MAMRGRVCTQCTVHFKVPGADRPLLQGLPTSTCGVVSYIVLFAQALQFNSSGIDRTSWYDRS